MGGAHERGGICRRRETVLRQAVHRDNAVLVTTVNYADRAALSIAGPALSKELGLDPIAMGYVFSPSAGPM